jgi:hypothetical protein
MKFRWTLAGAAAALAVAAPAHAADTVIATTAKPTPLAADAGRMLYSAWDGTSYRLTLLQGGAITTLPIAGSATPFTADLGLGPDGGEVAVYPRCAHGETGCDLYLYDLSAGGERKLTAADSPSDDEIAGAVWRGQLVFARTYKSKTGTRGVLYTRPLNGGGASRRVADQLALSVDLRGTRVAFSDSREFSNEPWLGSTSGGASRLTTVPGGGAAVDFLDALNPTSYGGSVYWLLVRSGDHSGTVIHRYNRTAKRDEQVATVIPGSASGFAYDAGVAYYSLGTEIHRVDGLSFEKAPPIKLR